LDDKSPAGYQAIKVVFKIEADISDKKKMDLIQRACKLSPVFSSLTKPVPVSVNLAGH
jgi:uncharacterized OsmC-like protein